MSELGHTVAVASRLQRRRAVIAYRGYVERDPLALLQLRPGREDPYVLYSWVRDRGPLMPNRHGDWMCASHSVCEAVLRDQRFGARPAEACWPGLEDDFDLSFLALEPVDPARLRRVLQAEFSPDAVPAHRALVERAAGALLDRIAAGELDQGSDREGGAAGAKATTSADTFDLVRDFTVPLTIAVTAGLLGVPESQRSAFTQLATLAASALDGVKSPAHAELLKETHAKLTALLEGVIGLRGRERGDDVISRVAARDGERTRPGELLSASMLLLIAGVEATVNLIGNAVLALMEHPDQWKALCADPAALAAAAVEETLRYDAPVQRLSRVAAEPVELAGRTVGTGQAVVVLLGGANRDPAAYERPDEFDLRRDGAGGPGHLAFPTVARAWIRQPLARLEAAVALQLLAERMPGLTRTGPVERREPTAVRGPRRLMLRTGLSRRGA